MDSRLARLGLAVVEEFASEAEARLRWLGYTNVVTRFGDGTPGWVEHAPFDKILVTAGAEQAPPALVEQLKPGGRMVLPMGPVEAQRLTAIDKKPTGSLDVRKLVPVRFAELETVR